MKVKTTTVCGDWHRSWGLGTNKIGKLAFDGSNEKSAHFTWKGHSQGRHGQVWNSGAVGSVLYVFETNEVIVEAVKGSPLTNKEDLMEAIQFLLNEQNKQSCR